MTSRSAAVTAIDSGHVTVSGVPIPKASTLVDAGTGIHVSAPTTSFVSRAGHKLAGAIDEFRLAVEGRRAIDVGASTGGFTDCLLQRGAASVVALDVGYGQLHWSLRTEERVTVIERTNIRHADVSALGAPFEIVVADLSFISLRTVADALVSLGDADTDYLLLIKPQFEAGPDRVGKGGIVRDAAVRSDVVDETIAGLAAAGLGAQAVARSSIEGTKGNVEVVGWFKHGPTTVTRGDIEKAAG